MDLTSSLAGWILLFKEWFEGVAVPGGLVSIFLVSLYKVETQRGRPQVVPRNALGRRLNLFKNQNRPSEKAPAWMFSDRKTLSIENKRKFLQIILGYLFIGHASYCILIFVYQCLGDTSFVNVDHRIHHLLLASFYALAEVILAVWQIYEERIERDTYRMLDCIMAFLCNRMGEARGNEAALLVAMLLDKYTDHAFKRSLVEQAAHLSEPDVNAGEGFTTQIIDRFCSMKGPDGVRAYGSLTSSGLKLLNEIREVL